MTFLREIEDLNEGKGSPCSWMRRLDSVKRAPLPSESLDFQAQL